MVVEYFDVWYKRWMKNMVVLEVKTDSVKNSVRNIISWDTLLDTDAWKIGNGQEWYLKKD